MKLNEYLKMKIETYKQQQSNDRNKREKSAGNQMNLIIKNAPKISSLSVESPIHPKTTRTALESAKNTLNKSQIQQLIAENLFLQAKLQEEQNNAQLATNQYLGLKMKCRKLEYEQLIHQKQKESELPKIEQGLTNEELLSEIRRESRGYIRVRIKSKADQIEEEIPKVYKVKFHNNKKVLSPDEINAEIYKMKVRQRIKQENERRLQKLRKKFLKCHLIILIVYRWSQNIRKKRKEKELLVQEQQKKAKLLYKEIKKYNQVLSQDIIQCWVSKITLRIYQGLIGEEMKNIFTKNNNFKQSQSQEIQKKWLIYFSIQFFKSIEQHTQLEKMPELLCSMMTLQLYYYQNKEASLFVFRRTTFLNGDVHKLSEMEISLIASEFILFSLIVPEIINLEQKQKYFNQVHKAQCRQIFMNIFSLLQILFMSTFYQMPETKSTTKINIIQKRIIQNKQTLEIKFEQDNQIEQSQVIIVGLEQKQKYEAMFKQHDQLLVDLRKLLDQIFVNIIRNVYI